MAFNRWYIQEVLREGKGGGGDFHRNLRNAAPDDPETRQAAQLPSTYC